MAAHPRCQAEDLRAEAAAAAAAASRAVCTLPTLGGPAQGGMAAPAEALATKAPRHGDFP